jgi:Restriction endonuclease
MPALIYSTEPSDWHDLQDKVASILRVCGCEAEVERTIETVRGNVEVDVLAVDPSTSPKLQYLCECKYWSRAVPQSVVHSFRTVVSDYGAHIGFLISRNGFQSGAYEAAQNSNIRLVNWFEFQEEFIERWKEGRYAILRQIFEELFEYYDFLSAPIGNAVSGNTKRMNEYSALLRRFSHQADANPWNRMVEPKRFPPALPHKAVEIDADGNETELVFSEYAALYDWHEQRTLLGISEFAKFVQRYRTGPVGA